MPANNFLKKPATLSEIMRGTTFELNSQKDEEDTEINDETDELMWHDVTDEDPDRYINPISCTFEEWKVKMQKIDDGVFKLVLKKAPTNAKSVDLERSRVVYHRNFYTENVDYPFDSTYLNGNKPDEICLPLKEKSWLPGFLEAISSMKEGEQSLFLISYKKMFGELGCPERVPPKADILCDIKVMKVETVGKESEVEFFKKQSGQSNDFSAIQESIQETSARAKDCFSKKKYDQASKHYLKIIQTVWISKTYTEEEAKKKSEIRKSIHTNIAVCYNKKEQWREALYHIRMVEEISVDCDAKVWYTKGRALMKLGELEEAEKSLLKAHRLNPSNKDINECVAELAARKNSYNEFKRSFAEKLVLN